MSWKFFFCFFAFIYNLSAEKIEVQIRLLEKPGNIPLSKVQITIQKAGVIVITSIDGISKFSLPEPGNFPITTRKLFFTQIIKNSRG